MGGSSFNNLVALTSIKNSKVETVLWKVKVPKPNFGGYSKLVANDLLLTPQVYWLLEEPIFEHATTASSNLYWFIVGMPVFQLTANMVLYSNDYTNYIIFVKQIIHDMLPLLANSSLNGGQYRHI